MEKVPKKEQIYECVKKHAGQKLTPRQIARWIFENYPEQSMKKLADSKIHDTVPQLISQIAGEVNPTNLADRSNVVKFIDKPRTFYYDPSGYDIENEQVEAKPEISPARSQKVKNKESNGLDEEDLYPILSKYLKSAHPKVYAKHINDHPSKKGKGPKGNMWIHPDLVGVERASENWREEINNCVNKKPVLKLWSFEVKQEINSSNLRESFFQAVSNSTWANFGYLVAGKINFANRKKREYIMSELRILSNLHGIGFIELNVDSPLDSQILIPAKEREEVDWDTANRLFNENPDFKTYIKNVGLFYEKKHWNEEYWNRMKEPDSPTH